MKSEAKPRQGKTKAKAKSGQNQGRFAKLKQIKAKSKLYN
jgi:hypothetical protein